MRVTAAGRVMILSHEAIVLSAYQDAKGVWTIGAGLTAGAGLGPVYRGMTITLAKAFEDFGTALRKYEDRVFKACGARILLENENDALVSFDFNTGQVIGGSVDDKINAGNKPAAMATLRQYTKSGGKTLPGLVRRREEEATLFLKGTYPRVTAIKVYDKFPGTPRLMTVEALRASPAAGSVPPAKITADLVTAVITPAPVAPAPSWWRRALAWFT